MDLFTYENICLKKLLTHRKMCCLTHALQYTFAKKSAVRAVGGQFHDRSYFTAFMTLATVNIGNSGKHNWKAFVCVTRGGQGGGRMCASEPTAAASL